MNLAQRQVAARAAQADLFTPEPRAVISPCGTYRYTLTRCWDLRKPSVLFCMLNPSTADASVDDATIRKCMGFAAAWGMGSIEVVNLFAFRSTDPAGLEDATDPIGPDNHTVLLRAFQPGRTVVCAWGARRFAEARGREVRAMLDARGIVPTVLRLTKLGAPEHPLFVPYDVRPAPWPLRPPGAPT